MKHTVKIRLLLVIVTLTAQWFSCAAQAQVKLSQKVLEVFWPHTIISIHS